MGRAELYKKWARLYFEAALAADDKIGSIPGYEKVAPPPVMMNCAHAVELSIKAALLEAGVPEDEVEAYRHKLNAAWSELKRLDASVIGCLTAAEEDLLNVLSDSHAGMSFRYGEPNRSGKTPVFGPTQLLVEKFLSICSAPSFEDLSR